MRNFKEKQLRIEIFRKKTIDPSEICGNIDNFKNFEIFKSK